MVHRRELDGQELVLGNQGDLYMNAMTWWDHDTGSVWSQPLGEAILGPRKGAVLELLPSSLTSWSSWRDANPDTVALDAPGRDARFDLADMVIVVEFGPAATAYAVPDLRAFGPANDVVDGVPIAVLTDPMDAARWVVFSRALDDQVLTMAIENEQLVDEETGTVWDPVRGRALSGPLEGEILDQLPGFTSFLRDYRNFWPEGDLWRP